MPTVIAVLVIVAIAAVAVISIIRDKKAGKCSCGNQCSSCAMKGTCHPKKDEKR